MKRRNTLAALLASALLAVGGAAHAQAKLKVGMMLPFTGTFAALGTAIDNGFKLAQEGIEVELIDPCTISPLDVETIAASVPKTGRLLVVDEDFAPFSFGGEVAARVAEHCFDDLDASVRRVHGAFAPTPYSQPLEKQVVPGPDEIAQAVRELIAE